MSVLEWLLSSNEPWTRYRTLVDLMGCQEEDPAVQSARQEMLAHPQVRAMLAEVAGWPGYALQRHNDARHPLYKLSTLADFGLRRGDAGVGRVVELVLAHQSPEGAFQVVVNVPRAFGGSGEDQWTWMACDAPTILYALLAMGWGSERRLQNAIQHLAGLAGDLGWHCAASPDLGKFKGPGKKADPCPIANVYALKALALVPEYADSWAVQTGVEMLLRHWEHRGERKYFLFGIGGDFLKLKYPFVWYDLLHVVDVLSRYPIVHADARFQEMVAALEAQAGGGGRYTATSMYQAWKGWSFANKKEPSPWLTFLAQRVHKRCSPGTDGRGLDRESRGGTLAAAS